MHELGATLEEAQENVSEAVALRLENARASDEEPPKPTTIAALAVQAPAA